MARCRQHDRLRAGRDPNYETLKASTQACIDAAYELLRATRELYDAAEAISSADSPANRESREALSSVLHYTQQWANALSRFLSFLKSPAMVAFVRRSIFLTGSAGQGKTHLFCDVAASAIAAGAPALVLLGQRFRSGDPWQQIAGQLGLGAVGRDVVVGAMEAAGEASNRRFLLMVDAVNEADDPASICGNGPLACPKARS